MFLSTPRFKFLDVSNYLALGLSYDSWCKVNGFATEKLVFPCKWLDDYSKLNHMRPVAYEALKAVQPLCTMNTINSYKNSLSEVA